MARIRDLIHLELKNKIKTLKLLKTLKITFELNGENCTRNKLYNEHTVRCTNCRINKLY